MELPSNYTKFFKSQSQEDKELMRLFGNKKLCNGTYIEMGALDGVRYSNSFVFNKVFGWKGVMIEASPTNYERLIQNRQNEIGTVHAGVCSSEQIVHWVTAEKEAVGGFEEFAAQSFKDRWWTQENIANSTEVLCQPLTKILEETVETSHFHFDFFSLDVEGAEYEALLSNDFSRYSFGFIFVEADERNMLKNIKGRAHLESNGYTFLRNHNRSDWFYNNHIGEIYRDIY
eukprot:CAMPEP_0113471512 /NCGR_PEP_ID=MMETSP0014_2-20120614/17014_1 /TAXON_ID=2857 /ORGANISM="Nitzschia sp." /LENGTH=229 /DNA_ID=CAMNT_0000364145 /DNA_START=401 /DNA_END=1090 /DNA_ORIENTATION=+ /assembly_acc=CAM_ASM_000159